MQPLATNADKRLAVFTLVFHSQYINQSKLYKKNSFHEKDYLSLYHRQFFLSRLQIFFQDEKNTDMEKNMKTDVLFTL